MWNANRNAPYGIVGEVRVWLFVFEEFACMCISMHHALERSVVVRAVIATVSPAFLL